MRYAWDLWPQYFSNRRPAYRLMIAPLLNYLRTWDAVSANRVDRFVANSRFVARRIKKYYGRDSTLVHPPVDTRFFEPRGDRREFYLMVAAMVPYKGVDLAVEAFNELGRPLKIVGDGYLRKRLTALAGPNVEFTGRISDEELRRCYQSCRAVIQPGAEDFGIVPLEAQSAGRPVIALGRAGALDTVQPLNRRESFLAAPSAGERQPAPTGVFFYEYTAQALQSAVRYFEKNEQVFRPELLRENALRFDRDLFKQKMRSLVAESLAERVETGTRQSQRTRAKSRRRA
jgi:glycosyltransferase involved in cell wall biosynthesis